MAFNMETFYVPNFVCVILLEVGPILLALWSPINFIIDEKQQDVEKK